MNWAAGIVAFGAVIATTAVLLVFQLGQARIFFSMARDGLLPPSFAEVHPRYRTPHVTTIWTGVAVAVLAAFANLDVFVELTNIGTLFAFVLVSIAVIVLRHTDPDRPRAFRTPFVPFVPLLGVAICLYLMTSLPVATWIRFGIWLADRRRLLLPLRLPSQPPRARRREAAEARRLQPRLPVPRDVIRASI